MGSIPYPNTQDSAELLRRTGWMRALATRLLGDPSAADDVVQEAWVATLEHPPRDAGEAWLGRLVRNFAWKRRRGERRRADHERAVPTNESAASPAATAERIELQRSVLGAIEALEEPFRTAVVERYLEGRTSADIARASGVPEGTVRWRLKRGLEELRGRLDSRFGSREAWSALLAPLALPPVLPLAAPEPPPAFPLDLGVLAMIGASKIVLGAVVGVAAVGVYLWRSDADVRGGRPASELEAAAKLEEPAPLAPLAPPPDAPTEPRAARVALPSSRAAEPVAQPAPAPEPLPARARLVMRFVDAQGAPFPGVVVVPQWHEEQGETSELDGRVALALAPEDDSLEWQVALFARRTGCATRLLRATAVRGQTSDLGDVLLEPGAQVSGRILDTQGLAILGAEVGLAAVELQEEGQDEWDEAYVRRQGGIAFDHTRTVTSDASGAFAFDGAPVGKHRLWAHAEGMRYGWSEPFEVRAGEDLFGVEVRLAALLATDHITGIVLDPAGEPLPRARLMSVSQVGYETSSSTRNVGEDGRFELVLRRDTTYTFVASDPEHRYTDAVLSGVEPGARDVELRLAEKQFFEVFVTDRDERPLELCRFELSAEIGGAVFSDRPEPKVLEPGLFGLGLPPKDFTLVVERDGYLPATFEDLRPGALGARVEVVLERAPRVRGRVVADGKPVAGARVTLHRELAESYFRNGFACLYPVEVESEGTTDAEGRFDLGCRSHGALFVRASAERWVATDLGPVDPAHEQDLRLELTPGGTLEGRVLLPNGADGAGLVVGINRGDGLARTQRAGPGGRFRFDHLMPGRWQVLQRDEELDPSSTTISNFDEPIEIEWSCTVEALRVTRFDLDLTDR